MVLREELQDLLQCIRAEGRFQVLARGLHTYPTGDKDNRRLFAACLELEELGLIHRHASGPGWVFWMPGQGEGRGAVTEKAERQEQWEQFGETVEAFLEILEEWAMRMSEQILPKVQQFWDIVWDAYVAQGAVYGETHEGMMRWMHELGEAEQQEAQAAQIREHHEMLAGLRRAGEKAMRRKTAYRRYADALGKSVANLTDAEKQQAVMNALLVQGEE